MRGFAVAASVGVTLLAAVACQSIAGLSDFQPRGSAGGGPGEGGASTPAPSSQASGGGGSGDGGAGSPASSSASTSTSTSSVATSSSTSSGSGCNLDHLVISEVRTRGPVDGNEDFVEILNPTAATVTLSPDFHIDVRGEDNASYLPRWTAGEDGQELIVIPPGKRALLVNTAGLGAIGGATPDNTYGTGIRDGGSIALLQGETVIDAVCFTCQRSALKVDSGCERPVFGRAPACTEPGNTSVQRKPSGGVDGCADTNDNAADLVEAAATPSGTTD